MPIKKPEVPTTPTKTGVPISPSQPTSTSGKAEIKTKGDYSYPAFHKLAPIRDRGPGEGAIMPTGKASFESFAEFRAKASTGRMSEDQAFEAYKRELDMMKDVHGYLNETQWETLLMGESASINTTLGAPDTQYKDWLLKFNWHDTEQSRQHFQELHPNILNNDTSWRQGLGTLRSNRPNMPTLAKAQLAEGKLKEQEKRFGF